jgi:hypothetical protein
MQQYWAADWTPSVCASILVYTSAGHFFFFFAFRCMYCASFIVYYNRPMHNYIKRHCCDIIVHWSVVINNHHFCDMFHTHCCYIQHHKDKGQDFPVNVTKAYRGSRVIAPIILNLATPWRRAVNFTLGRLQPREGTTLPDEYEAECPTPEAGQDVLENSLLPLPEFEPWVVQPVA